jgi:hypothetical protein
VAYLPQHCGLFATTIKQTFLATTVTCLIEQSFLATTLWFSCHNIVAWLPHHCCLVATTIKQSFLPCHNSHVFNQAISGTKRHPFLIHAGGVRTIFFFPI